MVAMYTCMQLHIHTCMQCIRMNVHTRPRGCTLYSILPCICYYIKPVMGDSILTCSAQKSLESASELILSVIIAGPVPVVHVSPMAFNAELHTFLSLPNRISKADSKLAPYIPNCKCKQYQMYTLYSLPREQTMFTNLYKIRMHYVCCYDCAESNLNEFHNNE